MSLRYSRRVLVVAGIIAALVASGFFALRNISADNPFPEAATIARGATSFTVLADRFSELAKEKGGAYAFNVLKVATLPPHTDTHLLGHTIGDVFYSQAGIAGIADCTQDFRNACSHTIVIGALNEFGSGDSTRDLIDEACKQAPGGIGAYTMCYHGLGHGVLAYFGFDLQKTVAFCKKTGTPEYQDEQYAQCVGGAIMELLSGGGHDREQWLTAREQYLKKHDPLAPCNGTLIPEQAKLYCYLYLTPHLMEAADIDIGRPNPQEFTRALSYCERLPKLSREREACFGGFGKDFIGIAAARDIRAIDRLDDSVYALTAAWCDFATVRDGTESCLRSALESVFWGGENDPAASFRFCAVTPQHLTDRCFNDLAGIINHYLRGETRAHWCTELPESYRSQCAHNP